MKRLIAALIAGPDPDGSQHVFFRGYSEDREKYKVYTCWATVSQQVIPSGL